MKLQACFGQHERTSQHHLSTGVWYLRRHTCTQPAASCVRQQSFWLSSGARWPERLVLVSLQGIKGTWASQQQGLSSDPWEAAPPLIWKVTFSHSNIKRHHIHSTQVTRWSLFQRRGWGEWDKEWVRLITRNNLRCLQLGMLLSTSDLDKQGCLSLLLKLLLRIVTTMKRLDEHGQHVVFTPLSIKHVGCK